MDFSPITRDISNSSFSEKNLITHRPPSETPDSKIKVVSNDLSSRVPSRSSNESTVIPSFTSPKHSDNESLSDKLSASSISDVSTPLFYDEADVITIKAAITRAKEAQTTISKSYTNFSKKSESIKQRKKLEIKQAESNAAREEALLGSAIIDTIYSSNSLIVELTLEKNKAIKAIESKADRDEKTAFIDYRKNILEPQEAITSSLAQKREIRKMVYSSNSSMTQKAAEIEARTLAFIDNSSIATDQDLAWAKEVLMTVDELRSIALADDADDDIDGAMTDLDRIDQALLSFSTQDTSKKDKFSLQETIIKAQENFATYRAEFLLAQTESDIAAGLIAKESSSSLFQQAHDLRAKAINTESEIQHASDSNKEKLEQQAEILRNIAANLESAAIAYDQIADACSVEIRDLPEMEKSFLAASTRITHSTPTIPSESQLKILELLYSVKINDIPDQPDLENRFDLTLFSQLNEIRIGYQEDVITSEKGKIVLAPPPSGRVSKLDRENYSNGINMIKLAIFRDFGAYALKRFEERFTAKIAVRNPLSLRELKAFIASETAAHPRSCFISSRQFFEEIILAEGADNDTRVIKSDGYSGSFNPFTNTPISSSDITISEEESTKQGIVAIRKSVKEFFKKAGFDDSQLEVIMTDFNNKFTDKGENAPLTIAALRSFMKDHDEVGFFSNLLLPHNRNRLLFATATALSSAIRTTPFILHFGLLAGFLIVVGTQAANDLTSRFRQAPRENG